MASIIKVNEYRDFGNNAIITSDGAGTVISTGTGMGKILQVTNDMISTTYLVSGDSATTIWTGTTLTLSNSSNKVLVWGDFSVGGDRGGSIALEYSTDDGGAWNSITTADMGNNDYYQDGVAFIGFHVNLSADANYSTQTGFNYLHTPGNTSAKYRLVMNAGDSSYDISLNRRPLGGYGGLSWVTQMEVAV